MPECGSTFQRTSPAPFTVWLLGLWIPAVSEQELKGQPHHGGSALEAVTTSPMDATIFQEHQGREPTTAQWPRTVTLGLKEPTDVVFLVTFYMQLQISNSFGEAGNLATVVLDSQKAIKNSCHLPRGMVGALFCQNCQHAYRLGLAQGVAVRDCLPYSRSCLVPMGLNLLPLEWGEALQTLLIHVPCRQQAPGTQVTCISFPAVLLPPNMGSQYMLKARINE
nr:uncharacterized protein LOC130541226 [Pan paniscus]